MEREEAIFDIPVSRVMTRDPKITRATSLAAAAVYEMETHGIMALTVVDDGGVLTGIVHLHDLLRSNAV
jgi:arabinose-5-phosphate isomerase